MTNSSSRSGARRYSSGNLASILVISDGEGEVEKDREAVASAKVGDTTEKQPLSEKEDKRRSVGRRLIRFGAAPENWHDRCQTVREIVSFCHSCFTDPQAADICSGRKTGVGALAFN